MSRHQLQLKQLLQTKKTDVMPSFKDILQNYNTYKQFELNIKNRTDHTKSSQENFQQQGRRLREKFKLAFETLDRQIDSKIDRFQHSVGAANRDGRKSARIMEGRTRESKRNRKSEIHATQDSTSVPKSKSKSTMLWDKTSSRKKQHKKRKPYTKQQQDPVLLQFTNQLKLNTKLILLSKQPPQSIEIYTCFICLKSNKEDSMWQKKQTYLSHLKSCHGIDPLFQTVLQFDPDDFFLFSHAYYKGRLVNLLNNIQNQEQKQIFYLLNKKRYDQLYFCSCKNRYFIKHPAIMNSEQRFYQHIKAHVLMQSPTVQHLKNMFDCSHTLAINNNLVTVVPNKQFSYNDLETNFEQILHLANQRYIKDVNGYVSRALLGYDRMNFLQLISCNQQIKKKIPMEEAFYPLPYCDDCELYFETHREINNHLLKIHNNKDQLKLKNFNASQLNNFMNNTKEYLKTQLPPIEQNLTQYQQRCLKAQLFVMSSYFSVKNAPFVCAECCKIFKQLVGMNKRQHMNYIKHIYFQHAEINPLNTHYLVFLQEKCEKEVEDQKWEVKQVEDEKWEVKEVEDQDV